MSRDLDKLKHQILEMGALVEKALRDSIQALFSQDAVLAREIIRGDHDVDQKELEVEEECLKTLALHQPVAADLRFVVAVLKVNNDLERIGDMAKNVAKRARFFAKTDDAVAPPSDLAKLADETRSMVSRALDSLVRSDSEAARKICKDDEKVDAIHKRLLQGLQAEMVANPARIPIAVALISVTRYLERVSDLATNIAEDVVFMVDGEVIKHGGLDDTTSSDTLPQPDLKIVRDESSR